MAAAAVRGECLNREKTLAIAFGGIITAFSVILIILTGLFPIAQLALPTMAGMLLIAAVIEFGLGRAALIYIAVSLLSLFLAPDKGSAIYYILFFGHYPILKNIIERIRLKPVQWIIKIVLFNACAISAYFAALKIFGISDDMLKYGYPLVFLIINVTFIVYDIAVSRLVVFYIYRIRKLLKIKGNTK